MNISFLEQLILAGGLKVHDEGDGGGADDKGGNDDAGAGAGADDKEKDGDNKQDAKTFTQEDVNNILAKNSKSATEKLLKDLGIEDFKGAKDGLKKLKEWQDSQKTDLEKLTGDNDALTKSASEKDKLIAQYKTKELASSKGVTDPKMQEKAMKLAMLSDEEDMSKALDAVLVEFPMFKGSGKPGQFGTSSNGGGANGGAADDARAAINKAMGIKPKA